MTDRIDPVQPLPVQPASPGARVARRDRDEGRGRRQEHERRQPEPEDDGQDDDGRPHVDVRA